MKSAQHSPACRESPEHCICGVWPVADLAGTMSPADAAALSVDPHGIVVTGYLVDATRGHASALREVRFWRRTAWAFAGLCVFFAGYCLLGLI